MKAFLRKTPLEHLVQTSKKNNCEATYCQASGNFTLCLFYLHLFSATDERMNLGTSASCINSDSHSAHAARVFAPLWHNCFFCRLGCRFCCRLGCCLRFWSGLLGCRFCRCLRFWSRFCCGFAAGLLFVAIVLPPCLLFYCFNIFILCILNI